MRSASWSYPYPLTGFKEIENYISFYPAMLECRLDGERVESQPGSYYGGWVLILLVLLKVLPALRAGNMINQN